MCVCVCVCVCVVCVCVCVCVCECIFVTNEDIHLYNDTGITLPYAPTFLNTYKSYRVSFFLEKVEMPSLL